MTILDHPPAHLFFTGKGGVGKTALACAVALRLADRGARVLLVSTDPASNLGQMLGVTLSNRPTPVPSAPRLEALDIDPERAAAAYRARVVAPYLGVWSEAEVASLREQLAGACTVEIAAFDEFAALLADGPASVGVDHVIFDTAPTGHTLRLLRLPRAWAGFLAASAEGASCLGPHTGMKTQEARFTAAMEALADPARTAVVLVARPDVASLREAERTALELEALGVKNQVLALNGVFTAADRGDPIAVALEARGRAALAGASPSLRALVALEVPLRPFAMVGLPALRALLDDAASAALARPTPPRPRPAHPSLSALIDALDPSATGLVMVMGKGGVGKTTIAAAIAVELASRGHAVHLTTTDPAAHVAATLEGQVEGLTIGRIDPAAESKAYVERVMATRGARLDDAGRALLAEDLRSPCYEEVAVFAAFSRIVAEARGRLVVLDTAPTGHTLLLLDATGAYHRQVLGPAWQVEERAGHTTTPLMRLRDPALTKILLVTLAEPTPVAEAARLEDDLRRAGIEPFAWIVNASLAAAGSRDPCLAQRIDGELVELEAVEARHPHHLAVVPWVAEAPVGVGPLRALARGASGS